MQTSLFISSDVHLCKFLQVTGGNWRSTLYVECCDCNRAISQQCKNLLCAFFDTMEPNKPTTRKLSIPIV